MGLDRGVVGEAQGAVALAQLAPLGGPRPGGLDDLETPGQYVVDCAGASRGGEAKALAQLGEDGGVLRRSKVEVAAEQQRRPARPFGRCRRAPQYVFAGELRPIVGRMQVCHAESRGGTGEGHRPPLGSSLVDRKLAPLDDLVVPDQGEVRAALTGGDQIGVEAGGQGAQGAERIA